MADIYNINQDLPALLDTVYYIDKVRFISRLSINEQRAKIPEAELLRHCVPCLYDQHTGEHTLVAPHLGEKGRASYWFTKVEATVCDDYFIEIAKSIDAGALSYLEVAMDIVFETMAEAMEYGNWFENNVQRRNKRHTTSFAIESDVRTFYLGKNQGKYADNYVRAYARPSKVQEIKGMPCYHIEFTLSGAQTIQRALGIQRNKETGGYRGLRSAMEMFWHLENKYLQYRTEGAPDYRAFIEPKKRKWGSLYISQGHHKRIAERLTNVRPVKPR